MLQEQNQTRGQGAVLLLYGEVQGAGRNIRLLLQVLVDVTKKAGPHLGKAGPRMSYGERYAEQAIQPGFPQSAN